MGKGSGGGQTTSTTNTSNVPEYARPYVETMLGATQKQLFDMDSSGNITGFQPYKAYGGTYDAQGNQTSYDPSKAIAGFSPMQQQAQQGIAAMRTPGQYGVASDVTGAGIMGGLGVANQATTGGFQNQVGGYMNPYLNMALQPALQEAQRQYGITGTQQQSQATQAGAFGGSREAIMAAENERNKNTAMNQIIGQGYNQAFQGAQQQYNQNMQNQLAGYGQAMQGAGQLANIGGQELAAQQGIYNAQNQVGATQQALEQQKINQAMTDYANAQQYPLMQLGTMSNMLRGLPMQASTTNQYAAAPNAVTQGIGAAGAIGSLMQANKNAEGGIIKGYASGGIMSYDVGGAVEADLEDMDVDGLKRQAKESSSPRIRQMAQRILAEKQMPAPRMAGGGIIAFAEGDQVEDNIDGMQMATAEQARDPNVMSDMDGIMMAKATPKPTPKAPVVPPPAPAAASTEPAAAPKLGILETVQKDQAAQQAIANKSIEDIMAERQAVRDKMGVGTDTARQEFRSQEMERRANLKDESERQRNMRLAEFFASWGSTPGGTLAAGMSALKKSIPGMVDDRKEAKKLERESDKIIFDIDQAIRLEKLGRVDEAAAIKEKAATHAQAMNKDLLTYQSQRDTNASQERTAKMTADRMAGAQTRTAEIADKRIQETNRYNLQRGEQEAKKALATLEAQIAKEKESTAYTGNKRVADANVRGADKARKEKAVKAVEDIESGWKARRDAAQSDLDFAARQLREVNKDLGRDKETTAPASNALPDWAPKGAKLAPDGNYYIEKGGKFVKVSPNN
jgi:hypothetical protein